MGCVNISRTNSNLEITCCHLTSHIYKIIKNLKHASVLRSVAVNKGNVKAMK